MSLSPTVHHQPERKYEMPHQMLEREAQRKQKFYDRLTSLLNKQIPRLVRKAEKQSRKGKSVFTSTTLRPMTGDLTPLVLRAVEWDSYSSSIHGTCEWIKQEANKRLADMGSPLVATVSRSFGISPPFNTLELRLPVETTPLPRKQ